MFKALGKEIFYLIRDREDIVFEVGGKGKGRSRFKGVAVQRKIIFVDGYDMTDVRKPLFLAGLCK